MRVLRSPNRRSLIKMHGRVQRLLRLLLLWRRPMHIRRRPLQGSSQRSQGRHASRTPNLTHTMLTFPFDAIRLSLRVHLLVKSHLPKADPLCHRWCEEVCIVASKCHTNIRPSAKHIYKKLKK